LKGGKSVEASLITLKLFLDELGIPTNIETVDKRKLIQKAVYLGQRSGVDLGYRFSWYLMGPYSTSLTHDYYKLTEAPNDTDHDYEKRKLKDPFKERLAKARVLFEVPENISITKENWLELLASVDYLRKISKFNDEEIRNKLRDEKPHLYKYIDKAKNVLQKDEVLIS
jgi:uncharacterized protein YwgA